MSDISNSEEISKSIERVNSDLYKKKNIIISQMDAILSELHAEYLSVISQKDIQIGILKSKEMDLKDELNRLKKLKNDLLNSIEQENKNYKHLEEIVLQKEKKIEELQDNYQDAVEMIIGLRQKNDELIRRLSKLEDEINALKSKDIEIENLKTTMEKLRNYINKGGLIYNQAINENNIDKLTQNIKESINHST
ncbi:MAG: hypothetical protein HXX81_05030 [Campylobacterales bacterium]|nr:hypothetical protein [Campylobacterales bacterium]